MDARDHKNGQPRPAWVVQPAWLRSGLTAKQILSVIWRLKSRRADEKSDSLSESVLDCRQCSFGKSNPPTERCCLLRREVSLGRPVRGALVQVIRHVIDQLIAAPLFHICCDSVRRCGGLVNRLRLCRLRRVTLLHSAKTVSSIFSWAVSCAVIGCGYVFDGLRPGWVVGGGAGRTLGRGWIGPWCAGSHDSSVRFLGLILCKVWGDLFLGFGGG